MPLSIAGVNANNPVLEFPEPAQKPLPTPTTGEETLQLASTGQSTAQIGANLGIPVSQVDTTLGITDPTSTQTGAIAAFASRLNVRA